MDIRKIALLVGVFCGAWSAAAVAGVEEKTTSADEETSPTTSKTYIESGPFGFLKIEIPTPGRIRSEQEAGTGKEGSKDEQVAFILPPLLELSATRKGPGFLFHLALVKIPFFKLWDVSTKGKLFAPDDDWNPFWPWLSPPKKHQNIILLDQPLFCFYDTVKLYENIIVQGKGLVENSSWFAARSRWLDTPLVSLWEKETWGKGKYYRWKFLDFAPAMTLGCEKGRAQFAVRVLDSPVTGLISGFRYREDGKERETLFLTVLDGGVLGIHGNEKERETFFLSTFLASIWQSRQKEEKKEWSFLRAPLALCSGVLASAEGEKKRLTILGLESIYFSYPGRGGAPKIALWHQRREDKDTSTQQFLRVPLIGPVWAAWEDKEEARWGIFPRLFFWKKFRY